MQQYADDAKISPWHKEDVYVAKELGLLLGDGENFDPQGTFTREMAATLAVRLYNKLSK